MACASHHGRTQQRRHHRLTSTARAKSRSNDRTKRENRGGTRQRGRVKRYAQTQPRTDRQTRRSSETHSILRVPETQAPVRSPAEESPSCEDTSTPGTTYMHSGVALQCAKQTSKRAANGGGICSIYCGQKNKGSGLCSIQCGHQSGQLKTPTKTSRNHPKLSFLLRFRTRQAARTSSRKQQRKILHKTHKANPSKTHENHKNEGFYSPQTGQSQGHLAAVASPTAAIPQSAPVNKKRTPPSQSGQNSRNGRWPLACFAHCGVGVRSACARPPLSLCSRCR